MVGRVKQAESRRLLAPAAALVALLLLAGCFSSTTDRTASIPESARPAELSPAQREHERIIAAYGGIYSNPRLEKLLTQTVERLVAASDRPDVRYSVTILNSPAINAFALPNGYLYVTRGLLALSNDSSELASVLAHEMAHVIARHAAIRETQVRQAALASSVASEVLDDEHMSALKLAKSKIAMASFSRTQEFEADNIGVGISAKAGFDPYGAMRFLTSMGRNAEFKALAAGSDPRSLDFTSTHPATPERVRSAQTSARQFSAPGSGEREKAEYLASLDGLVYGDDPTEGYVRGRRYRNPRLGFTFLAPPGFTLDNSTQAVFGVKDGGGQALRLDVVRVPAEQSLGAYLNSGWIEGVDAGTVEETTINTFRVATAVAKGDQWTFRLYAMRFGTDVFRFIFATKQRTAETDRIFRDSVGSFRRLSVTETDRVKPLRLRVVTVGAADTVERLAGRMSIADRAVERFRVLNGLGPTEGLKPGDKVKIIVE